MESKVKQNAVERIDEHLHEGMQCEGLSKTEAVRDLLIDLRHYCEAEGVDLYAVLDRSYDTYLCEKNDKTDK